MVITRCAVLILSGRIYDNFMDKHLYVCVYGLPAIAPIALPEKAIALMCPVLYQWFGTASNRL